MHPTSLGQATDKVAVIHSVEERLLFLHHTLEVYGREIQQVFELFDPALRNLSRSMRHLGLFKESGGFLMVLPRQVQGAFQCGFMFESRFLFHETILGLFPGRCQSTGRENSNPAVRPRRSLPALQQAP